MSQIIRFGVGGRARRAAMKRADDLWAKGKPARAMFKVQQGGWIVVVYQENER